jgi:hypothetical protein
MRVISGLQDDNAMIIKNFQGRRCRLYTDLEHRVSGLSGNKLHERLINVSQIALLIGHLKYFVLLIQGRFY